jgi:type I restriction enzyme S subunit
MKTIELRQCCRFLSGGTPSKANAKFWVGPTPWYSPKDIKSFDLTDSQDHISDSAISSSATHLLSPGTILVVGRSGVLAHTLPVGIVRSAAAFNQDIKALIPKPGFDPNYVALFLKAQQSFVLSKGVKLGATVHSLKSGFIEALQIPVISIEHQIRIATHVKSQLAAASEARQAATDQIAELTHLAHAIIRETLNHPDTETHVLGDVLDEVKRGVGPSWADYPVLGATRNGLAPAREPVGKNPERYKPVFTGTVFYNPMRILIGSIAMVDDHDTPGITSPDYVALRGRAGLVDSRWFYYWLRSPEGERCIASLARGAVRERMLFNRLAEGEITLPPYEIQVKASLALADIRPLKTHVEAQLRDIELLPSRLLAQAFDTQGDHQNDE